MLAWLALIAGALAALLKFLNRDGSIQIWLIIVAVILLAVHAIAYDRPWYPLGRTRAAP